MLTSNLAATLSLLLHIHNSRWRRRHSFPRESVSCVPPKLVMLQVGFFYWLYCWWCLVMLCWVDFLGIGFEFFDWANLNVFRGLFFEFHKQKIGRRWIFYVKIWMWWIYWLKIWIWWIFEFDGILVLNLNSAEFRIL